MSECFVELRLFSTSCPQNLLSGAGFSLQPQWFPHAPAQDEFEQIVQALNMYGEAVEGAGSVLTTLGTMSDDGADALAGRIHALADRYLA